MLSPPHRVNGCAVKKLHTRACMQTRKCVNFQLELYAIAATCKKNLFAHDAKELKFRA